MGGNQSAVAVSSTAGDRCTEHDCEWVQELESCCKWKGIIAVTLVPAVKAFRDW